MGYKLAGYTMVGNCEIDPGIIEIYRKNLHPEHSYLMDIRDLVATPDKELPEGLFNLDILDGSPPCSVFSSAGKRDKGWGVEKRFREGQKMQRLDDLFFAYIALAKKLQPKIVVAENVVGLIKGNARGYVNEILKAYKDAGYTVQIFKLNAANMGVPQARERVFFVGHRIDLDLPKLELKYQEKPITFGEVRTEKGKPLKKNGVLARLLSRRIESDQWIGDISERIRGKGSGFTCPILHDGKVAFTLTSGATFSRYVDACLCTDEDFINIQTFPQDYDFGKQSVQYVCGMSVPPVMMAQISSEIYRQWLGAIE